MLSSVPSGFLLSPSVCGTFRRRISEAKLTPVLDAESISAIVEDPSLEVFGLVIKGVSRRRISRGKTRSIGKEVVITKKKRKKKKRRLNEGNIQQESTIEFNNKTVSYPIA